MVGILPWGTQVLTGEASHGHRLRGLSLDIRRAVQRSGHDERTLSLGGYF